jgi:hypothetical protein
MADFGPSGGPGGSPFEEMAPEGQKIGTLIIRSGGPRNVVSRRREMRIVHNLQS